MRNVCHIHLKENHLLQISGPSVLPASKPDWTVRAVKRISPESAARPAAAFLCCAALLSAMYAVFGLYPFGSKTLAWCDMSQQVIPLLMELKDILSGQSGIFLNLQNAGGMSFWGVFFFFLASPFHILVLFVDKADIYMLVNVLVLAKLSLAASTASLFFHREAPGLRMSAHLALCVSYGLCGYGLLYYQNLVWLDILCLFPLTMLGLVKLLEDGRAGMLTVCLTASVIVNYYLSYMLFLGMLLCGAVFIYTYVPKERRGETAGKLGASAATALLAASVVWLPSLLQCLSSARTGGGLVQSVRSGDFFTKLSTALPVLLCSAGATAVPLLSRILPQKPKERAIAICWTITALPMVVEPINKLWHMGSYQAFPVRYGYMPVLFGLWYLARCLNAPQPDTGYAHRRCPLWLALPLTASAAAGAYILCARFDEISSYTSKLWVSTEGFFYLAIFWLACLAAVLGICRAHTMGFSRRFTSRALLGIVLLQAAVQVPAFVGSAANTPSKSLSVLSASRPEDDGLYRVRQESKFTHVNLIGGMGYPTLNHYTSLTDARYLAAMKKLGYSSYWMETSGCCGTAVSDILMSNKYTLNEDLSWTPSGSGNLGYIVPSGVLPETLELGDRLQMQNELGIRFTGRALFTRYEPLESLTQQDGKFLLEPGSLHYQIQVGQRETLYFDAFDCISTKLREAINDGFSVRVNGADIAESYPTQRCNGILNLGTFENETVNVEITVHKQMQVCSFGVWGLGDTGALTGALSNASLRYESGRITGTAEAGEGQSLFLSVPMYSGMRVQVNGSDAPVRQVLDCFMEIPLPEGRSQITVSYIPAGLIPGAAISAGTVLLLLLLWLLRNKRPIVRARSVWYRCAPALLKLGFAAAIAAVYLFPTVAWITKFI